MADRRREQEIPGLFAAVSQAMPNGPFSPEGARRLVVLMSRFTRSSAGCDIRLARAVTAPWAKGLREGKDGRWPLCRRSPRCTSAGQL